MNSQTNRAAEVLYSTTYVEDYLDTVENLPDEIQRLLSRLTLLDAEGKTLFEKIHGYFAQLVRLKKRNRWDDNEAVTTEVTRVYGHMTVTLIKSQEIGDEKIQVAQQIQDFVDNRLRQLEVDSKTLDSVQKPAETVETLSASPYSSRGDTHNRLGSSDASTSERAMKRVRRVRLGPSIIPNKTANLGVPSNSGSHQLISSTNERRVEEGSSTTCLKLEALSTANLASESTVSTLSSSEKEKPKVKGSTTTKQNALSVAGSSSQENRKDSFTAPSCSQEVKASSQISLPVKKRTSEPELIGISVSSVHSEVSGAERKSDHALRTPKKKERKMVVSQKQERKGSTASASYATKRVATKRKVNQDGAVAGDPDEATYCVCVQISYGDMIGCDNDLCPIEWFHFSCVQLTAKPKGKWYCPSCRDGKANVMKSKEVFLKELEQYNREREGR